MLLLRHGSSARGRNIGCMETLFYFSIGISAASLMTAGLLKLYRIGYARGYDDGKHCGFTQGLYAAAKREDRRKRSQYSLQPS